MTAVDLVLIGRNEGARLVASLASVKGQARRVVYVDSGSDDGSVDAARLAGAEVVLLDTSVPFTAARARNAGFARLEDTGDTAPYVQFIDGDCTLVNGWIDAGAAQLDAHPETAMVTGWRSEIAPEASVYNRLCDWEWHRPAGPILACGGDMMVRAEVFRTLGGFDPTVIAAEDDEFGTRMRKAGWVLERLPQEMTRHDAAMHGFGQWWQRAVRTGHGFAQVGHLHPEYFLTERTRVYVYGLALPLLVLASIVMPVLILPPLAAYGYNFLRTRRGLLIEGVASDRVTPFAALLTLSKLPNMIGVAKFHWRRLRGRQMQIIEYK